MRKRRGPRMDPWGTPDRTEREEEEDPLKTTCWERDDKYEWSHLSKIGGQLTEERKSINGAWGTVSNAFFRSRKQAQIALLFWRIIWKELVANRRAEEVERLGEKPNW